MCISILHKIEAIVLYLLPHIMDACGLSNREPTNSVMMCHNCMRLKYASIELLCEVFSLDEWDNMTASLLALRRTCRALNNGLSHARVVKTVRHFIEKCKVTDDVATIEYTSFTELKIRQLMMRNKVIDTLARESSDWRQTCETPHSRPAPFTDYVKRFYILATMSCIHSSIPDTLAELKKFRECDVSGIVYNYTAGYFVTYCCEYNNRYGYSDYATLIFAPTWDNIITISLEPPQGKPGDIRYASINAYVAPNRGYRERCWDTYSSLRMVCDVPKFVELVR